MKPVQEIFSILKNPKQVVIVPHQKPDADAMGASLALYHFLKQLGHTVTVISPTNWASWVNWMPGSKEVIDYDLQKEKAIKILDEAALLFCLDFNAFHRVKNLAAKLEQLTCIKILIDHHQQPDEKSFDFGITDSSKSSTCEMIYDLINSAGYNESITKEIAECIYAGVVADTGSFRFSSTSADVHRLVADLMQKGLEHLHVHNELFDNFLENRMRFIGHVLSNRMEVFYEYNTILLKVPKSDLVKYQIKTGDTEGLVNYPQSIRGIKLVAIVIDRDEERKWSFRSKGNFDCNIFARKYFEGGGHFNASGGRSSDSLENTVQAFYTAMKENKSLLQ
ncbi:MAG TPA: bifunctional oligoribonuclease/PAP phosphatase NrnA [Chitinophagaceae bacterium]|nr:bifunctional oligoribonuclease/PAP phosphatase NrnA [Chitinophagaceae bacterium]